MLYAKVDLETKEILEYPVHTHIIRERFSKMNVSLPNDLREADLRQFGYYSVQPDINAAQTPPVGYRFVLTMPRWEDDALVRQWVAIPLDPDFENRQWAIIRARRNKLLRETDWTELPSIRTLRSIEWAEKWDTYRQKLRDITKIQYTTIVTFPEKPNETE